MTIVKNQVADALPSRISLPDLGKAMSQIDISSIPPEKRRAAVMDHLMRITAASIYDSGKAAEISASRVLRRNAALSSAYPIRSK